MATETVNPSAQTTQRRVALTRRVRWHDKALDRSDCMIPSSGIIDILDDVQDIGRGISTVMDILMFQGTQDSYEDEENSLLVLDAGDREALLFYVAATVDMLVDKAYRKAEWAYEYHTPEGREEKVRRAKGTIADANRLATRKP